MDEIRSKISSRLGISTRSNNYLDKLWFNSLPDNSEQLLDIKRATTTRITQNLSINKYVESGYISNYFE